MKRFVGRLEVEERARLGQLVRTGKVTALRIRHAKVLLAVDESDVGATLEETEVAAAYGVAVRSIESLRKQFVEEGLDAPLERKQQVRSGVERMFDDKR